MFGGQLITGQRIYLWVVIASSAIAGGTLASLFGRHLYLELATHFRLQYALGASVCALLLIGFRSWKLVPLAVCCAVVNWAFIVPYYSAPSRHDDPPAGIHLRLVLANVLNSNQNYAALTAAINQEQPDITVLQEFTEEWQSNLTAFASQYPYAKLAAKAGGSGMALFSRYPIEQADVLTLDTSGHQALHVRINVQGTPLLILGLHPPTPVRSDKFSNRNLQFAQAAALIKTDPGAKLLIGDLNTTMWSPYFSDLLRDSGLHDARVGFGLQPSWPMPLPSVLQIPIDQCLVGDHVSVQAIRVGARTGSDHRPLVVDVNLPKLAMQASR